ncbi:hypothetical protein [Maricaulis parjimensis]|uniref:hypothetical protein n=1 Tax=Maricaulis parjimensis TaxID=144023 RepID=UPI00193A271F|nr:hypothetical protein [Maricaulis parjimensis]
MGAEQRVCIPVFPNFVLPWAYNAVFKLDANYTARDQWKMMPIEFVVTSDYESKKSAIYVSDIAERVVSFSEGRVFLLTLLIVNALLYLVLIYFEIASLWADVAIAFNASLALFVVIHRHFRIRFFKGRFFHIFSLIEGYLEDYKISISDDGLKIEGNRDSFETSWSSIVRLDLKKYGCLLSSAFLSVYVSYDDVPKSYFVEFVIPSCTKLEEGRQGSYAIRVPNP